MEIKRPLTAEEARDCLRYDPLTGMFTWIKAPSKGVRVGARAGTLHPRGYRIICVGRRLLKEHRLAWLFVHGVWPAGEIDHINGAHADNRIGNLRDVPRQHNQQNIRRPMKTNAVGVLGVKREKGGKFSSAVYFNGRQFFCGMWGTADEAHAAYVRKKRELHEGCTL